MKWIQTRVKMLFAFLRSGKVADPRLPSLLVGMQKLMPRATLKEVVNASSDRRQWGVLAAAWIGVSEREFMSAAARELELEFCDRVPVVTLAGIGGDQRDLLSILRKCASAPILEASKIVGFITVDPAEIRDSKLYDGSQRISLGCWSDISRSLDVVERELDDLEVKSERAEFSRYEEMTRKVLEIILHEATSHGASAVELITFENRSQYQFYTSDGKRGHGAIHQGIVPAVLRYLKRFDGVTFHSIKRGEVLVRSLGSSLNYRLAWASAATTLPQSVAVPSQSCPVVQEITPPSSTNSTSKDPQGESSTSGGGQSTQPTTALSHPSSQDSGIPILVIDDNPMFCRVLERLLQRDGYAPSFAENGVVALERLEAVNHILPRVIVSDLHMPIMNGKELLKHLKSSERFSPIPVIMLTSDDDVDAELSLLEIGADAFVSKLKDPRVLCAQVRRLTQQSSLREAA